MASWDELLGRGSIVETIAVWGILNQLIQALLGPFFEDITEKVNSANPVFPLTPADLADAIVRGAPLSVNPDDEARKSGIDQGRFDTLKHLAGEPPGLEWVLEAHRRGFLDWNDAGPDIATVERAIKTSRVFPYWEGVYKAMLDQPLSPGEAVNAVLRNQIDRTGGEREAYASGINQDRFQILLDSAGRPPSPTEAIELVRRKLIPVTGTGPGVLSLEQAISEGDTKNKWFPGYVGLLEYHPPPRTVTALLKSGSLTTEQANTEFQVAGMTPALAAAYVHNARGEKLAGTKQLAEGTVLTLFDTHAIDQATAERMLTALGYDATEVGLILQVSELQRELKAVNSAVTRVGTLYVNHKITRQAALDSLQALEMGPAHANSLLADWDTERAVNVRQLTPAQIVDAWEYAVIDQGEAMAELQAIGYTPRDAWILLSNKAKGALPNPPSPGPAGPGAIP